MGKIRNFRETILGLSGEAPRFQHISTIFKAQVVDLGGLTRSGPLFSPSWTPCSAKTLCQYVDVLPCQPCECITFTIKSSKVAWISPSTTTAKHRRVQEIESLLYKMGPPRYKLVYKTIITPSNYSYIYYKATYKAT